MNGSAGRPSPTLESLTAPAEDELTGFDPSARRGEAVGAHMRERLAASLRYIIGQAAGHLQIPQPEMDGLFARLAGGPVSPQLFGIYCDLVLAIDANALDEAQRFLVEISRASNAAPGPRIKPLGDPESDPEADRYRRLVDTDPDMPFTIWPPPPYIAAAAQALVTQALALIDAGNPGLAGEIRALLQEIVVAVGSDDPDAVPFEGVSSFLLWGAIVLEARANKTVIDMVQALAHESGHNLLFGLCADGPLHENGDAERYSSPLRIDPRPMDGIIHAAYVTARMHQAVQRLAAAGVLDAAQAAEARTANLANARRFAMGMQAIDRHARLTPRGRAVMAGARAYMSAYV